MRVGDTPLIDAARNDRAAEVAALLADGADVNEPQTDGVTALYIASQEGHAEIATELLFANADVDQAITEGDTPLHMACHHGHAEVVAMLLAANAEVDQSRDDGVTSLEDIGRLAGKAAGHVRMHVLPGLPGALLDALPFAGAALAHARRPCVADTTRFAAATGWTPPVALADGLAASFAGPEAVSIR